MWSEAIKLFILNVRVLFVLVINFQMPNIVGIWKLMTRTNATVFCSDQHRLAIIRDEKSLTLRFWQLFVILLLSHLVSCDRCGIWLYRFLIIAVFLTLKLFSCLTNNFFWPYIWKCTQLLAFLKLVTRINGIFCWMEHEIALFFLWIHSG